MRRAGVRKSKNAMAFPPVADCVEVQLRALIDDQHVENRWFVNVGAPPTDLVMNSVAGVAASWINPTYRDLANANVTFTEIVVTDKSVVDGAEISVPVNLAGLVDSAPYPNETAFCISCRSGLTGRSRRGRIFLFPPSSSNVTPPNKVTDAYRTGAIDAVQALMDAYATSGFAMGVVSYVSGGAPRVTPLFTRYVSAIAVDNLLDSMRSRKPGNGS